MKWAFELLGLPMEADASSIKRSYAQRLRTTRPDENPEGFQRLHVAYKTALAYANRPVAAAERATPDSVDTLAAEPRAATAAPAVPRESPPQPRTPPLAVPPTINSAALADEVIQAAAQNADKNAMLRWLNGRQELWSILAKQQTGQRVLQRMFEQPQAIAPECMDAVLQFFDLDHVLSGINPLALQQLRTRQMTLWQLHPDNHRELARRVQLATGSAPPLPRMKKDLALLHGPLRWHHVMRRAIQPGRVRDIGRLVRVIWGTGSMHDLPLSIDRQHASFWLRASATDGPMNAPRFTVGAWRAGALALVAGSLSMALSCLSRSSRLPDRSDWVDPIATAGSIALGVLAIWLLYVGLIWLDRWQGLPESFPVKRPWLRRLTVPALCVLAALSYDPDGSNAFALTIGLGGFVLAVRRLLHRSPRRPNHWSSRIRRLLPMMAYIGILLASSLFQQQQNLHWPLPLIAAAAATSIWLADMWRHRAYVHPKFSRS